MLDHNRRHAGLVDLGDTNERFVLTNGRKTGAGLVEEEHSWLHHERSTHRNHLAFSTRERTCTLLEALTQFSKDARDELKPFVVALGRLVETHLKVLFDRETGEDVV